MKVLHVLDFSPPFYGGLGKHLDALGSVMRDEGHELHLAFPRERAWFEQAAKTAATVSALPQIVRPVRSGFADVIDRVGTRAEYDIVHLHFSFALPLALALKPSRRRRFRVVYHWHNPPKSLLRHRENRAHGVDAEGDRMEAARRKAGGSAIRAWLKRSVSDLAARSGDGIIRRHVAVSGEIRDLLVEHRWTRPRKIVCIPNRLPRMPNGAAGRIVERRELVVGSVANFREQKDHATLLRAFARCLQHRSDIRLLLVGDGTTRPAALALARELGIEARVDFRGYMGVPDAAYREMDVFVLSSHYEGQGIVVLEAMAHGLPVVATDLPAIRETMEGCEMEMLVPSRDPDAMSSAILKLLESPSLRADMAQMARRAAARLGSTEDWARSLIDLYTAVLGER